MSRSHCTGARAWWPVLFCAALLAGGCESTVSVEVGAIRVRVTASGNNIDPDGYTIRVTGGAEDRSQAVDANGEVVFAVPVGSYIVELLDKADNCVVDLNPQRANVASGVTTRLDFNTLCG